jgi:hypothetical protein
VFLVVESLKDSFVVQNDIKPRQLREILWAANAKTFWKADKIDST